MTGPKIKPLQPADSAPIRVRGRPAKHGETMEHTLRVRVTENQWRAYYDNGGADWLRGLLSMGG